MKRLSLASMLTALIVLATSVISTFAQTAGAGRPSKASAPRSGKPVENAAPKVAARPTPADAKPGPSQAEVSKHVLEVKKGKKARKFAAEKAKWATIERSQMQSMWRDMQAMMRQSEMELAWARSQAAQMEANQRWQAVASMRQLDAALSNARACDYEQEREYRLSHEDPEQYQQLMQARFEAYRNQQRAIENLSQTVNQVLQGRQGGSVGSSPGTSGSTPSSSGSTVQPYVSNNPGRGATTPSQPATSPGQGTSGETRRAQDDAARRYKPF